MAIGKIKHERSSGVWVKFYQKVIKKENFFGPHVFGARLETPQNRGDLGQVGINNDKYKDNYKEKTKTKTNTWETSKEVEEADFQGNTRGANLKEGFVRKIGI